MFSLPLLIIITGIMLGIQIGIWQAFPSGFRDILFSNPILAFLVNMGGSSLVLVFTGTASFVGVCNLGASVLFGLYAIIYKKSKGIEGLGIEWNFVFPRLVVNYKRRFNNDKGGK